MAAYLSSPSETAQSRSSIRPVSYQEELRSPINSPSDSGDAERIAPPQPIHEGGGPIYLDDVLRSVERTYPLLVTALLERDVAEGKRIAAWGEFDTQVKVFSTAAPEGFYQTYRNGVSLEQPLFGGGGLYGAYKIGDGNFQPWYKERETNEGGEFTVGYSVPLLKDRFIDKRRAGVFQADLARQAVEPVIQAQLLEFTRAASRAYWSWVAAGRSLVAQRELLANAKARVKQVEDKVTAGDLPRIARINNEQLIASREAKVIEARRKLQQSAIKLSLFLRDDNGQPMVPDESSLPQEFPARQSPAGPQLERDIASAITASPAVAELDLVAEQLQVELDNARNATLPKLDARVLASKDIGAAANPKGDKTPFELEVGLYGQVPLQRRTAYGKIASLEAKLAQISAKREFIVNKIAAAVRDASSALRAASERIERAEANLRLAREALDLGRIQFEAGDIDLIALNIYEKAVTDAQLLLISAQADFFVAVADYQAALARDPLAGE